MADRYQDRPFAADPHYDRGDQRAPQKAESDPLAELARLIGQTDPFANFGRDTPASPPPRANARETYRASAPVPEDEAAIPPAPSWMNRVPRDDNARREAPSAVHPVKRYATPQPSPEPDYQDSPAFADEHVQPDPTRYDDQLYGQMDPSLGAAGDHQGFDDPYAFHQGYDDGSDGAALKPRRGGMTTVVVVLALAVLGTGAAFGYRTYMGSTRSGEPPVIKADAGPTKMIPPAPNDGGGKPIQDRLASGNGTEAMVSREEQPVDGARPGARVVLPPMNQNANTPGRPPVVAPNNGTLAGDEPRKIRTFTVKPEQGDPAAAPSKQSAPARTAALPPTAAATRAPPAPVANANASTNAPLSISPQQAAETPRAAARVASTAPSAQPPATSAASGGYVVQVSSQRSETDAQASYKSLQGKFPAVLGSHSPLIKRADLGEKGIYFRAMVGPFGSSDEASQLCSSLKSAGGQCVVQRN